MAPLQTYRILVHDVSNKTKIERVIVEDLLRNGDQIQAFGRGDALVVHLHENCPPRFNQWIDVLVLDDRIIRQQA